MNHANLTARYRPQTFAELAGQETVKSILSRAAAESKVAPAYLFSGTRGVGKTTVARIFAKALNCEHAPGPEPCNACERCRQITLGTAVDVVEIDGASNRGIDDVRKLKEVVGYAPMEGRYKVFIIDEAHMLSRDAFNALLKTLEEPPGNVTFILATTEPHKFPATIISRCQHYVFKRLPEHGLEAHLTKVLSKEGLAFDDAAVRLIARRAAGSVRDAMSLLGQVLALGGESLTEGDTRTVLGLAGQELFFSLFKTLRDGDSVAVTKLVGELLDSGLDLGFFLREMALCWRNMFILRQAGAGAGPQGGEAALAVLDIPEKEANRWKEEAGAFDLAHIHAAWQMTIDGQRRVLTSLEPALALELLLLNIAMLPRLLPLDDLARLAKGGAPTPVAPQGAAPQGAAPMTPATPSMAPASPAPSAPPASSAAPRGNSMSAGPDPDVPAAPPEEYFAQGPSGDELMEMAFVEDEPTDEPMAVKGSESVYFGESPDYVDPPSPEEELAALPGVGPVQAAVPPVPKPVADQRAASEEPVADQTVSGSESAPRAASATPPEDTSWHAFLRFCKQQQGLSASFSGMLRTVSGEWRENALAVTPQSEFCTEQLRAPETYALFSALVSEYYGQNADIVILSPPKVKTPAQLKEELREHPAVQLLEKEMGARLIDFGIVRDSGDTGPLQ